MGSKNKGNCVCECVCVWGSESLLASQITWPDSSPQLHSGAQTSACAGCKHLLGWHTGREPGLAVLGEQIKGTIQVFFVKFWYLNVASFFVPRTIPWYRRCPGWKSEQLFVFVGIIQSVLHSWAFSLGYQSPTRIFFPSCHSVFSLSVRKTWDCENRL